MRSPYAVLGISKTAKDRDIKNAFRTLAKTWHPDANRDNVKAAEVFAEINSAYNLLIDQNRRKLFDKGVIDASGRRRKKRTEFYKKSPSQNIPTTEPKSSDLTSGRMDNKAQPAAYKANGTSQNSPFGDFSKSSFSDMISQIFGSEDERVAAEMAQDHNEGRFGQDTMSNLSAAFDKWDENQASLKRAPDRYHNVDIELEDVFTGKIFDFNLGKKDQVSVAIPIGVEDGAVITLAGQGSCRKGEIPGDVIVTVHYKSNEKYWVRNNELHMHLPVDLAEAVLGGPVSAETPDGPVTFELPEWTSSNHIIRIPNRGLPDRKGVRGDLCANICILLPERPNAELKRVLKDTRKSIFI